MFLLRNVLPGNAYNWTNQRLVNPMFELFLKGLSTMFCLRGSSQRVVEPVPVTSETKAQKPSLGDINLNHEIFRRKSMIANPNVQLVKIKTVVAFRNARNGGGSEGAENNDRLPSLGE